MRAGLDAQVRLLRAWNAAINLTALRSDEAIARGHVLDSLLAVPYLRTLVDSAPTILDLGSGAGYPGIPVALALPARRLMLVDSIRKKAAFLEVVARATGDALRAAGATPPELIAVAERAEDLADEPDQREAWDLVLARAVGSVAEVAELGLPLIRRGGHLAVWKRDAGDGSLEREVGNAGRLVAALGGANARIVPLAAAVRLGLAGHCLVVVAKRRQTPDCYPRSAGERRRRALP
jgi:16S rRNA (guanine527-N7)-methyltransferase